jgi:hypothetical protein
MSLHSNQTYNHPIENWVYANAAARTGATGFVTADVGKVAYQTDSGDYYRLTATTPTWQLISQNTVLRSGDTMTGGLTLVAGTSGVAPLKYQSGTDLSTPVAGACEFDGTTFHKTIDTVTGRGIVPVQQYFRLTGSGTGITTIADFFGSNDGIPLTANAVYEIEWHCYFSQATAGTATWTIVTATTALANLTAHYIGTPTGGIGAVGTPQMAGVNVTSSSSTALPVTGTEATSATHFFRIYALLTAGNGTSNTRLRLTMSAGTATPLINSHFFVRRIVAANTGTFVA